MYNCYTKAVAKTQRPITAEKRRLAQEVGFWAHALQSATEFRQVKKNDESLWIPLHIQGSQNIKKHIIINCAQYID